MPVTALNWQDPPANRWAFWHVGDLLPTYRVPRGDGAPGRCLPPAAGPTCSSVPVTRMDRTPGARRPAPSATCSTTPTPTPTWCCRTAQLVAEWYGPLGAPDRTHALMSVTKSVVGCVAAVLVDRGLLDPDAESRATSPNWLGSGYAGALVRHVLDMRSGVGFGEEYADPDVRHPPLDEWVGWQPGARRASPAGSTRSWPRCGPRRRTAGGSCTARPRPTCWAGCASAPAGRPMAELISELIWQPMGAEHDADHLRRPRHRRARRRSVRDRPRPGAGSARCCSTAARCRTARGGTAPVVAAAVAAPGLGGRRRRAVACSSRRPPSSRSPAAGTATSSGSAPASTATCCCAWASTARWCTSAGAPAPSA